METKVAIGASRKREVSRCVRSILVLALLVCVQTVWGRPAQVILLRHAEKPADDSNVHLSAQGEERARALVRLLAEPSRLTTNGLPAALFATRPTKNTPSRRTIETLAPVAQKLKMPIATPFSAKEYAALARYVLRNPEYDGKTVVICWVHDFLPELAKAFDLKSKVPGWKSGVFDRVWLITLRKKKASLENLPQHVLPGDSAR